MSPGMSRSRPLIVLVVSGALVVGVGGLTNPFTYWNLLPLLIAWIVVLGSAGSREGAEDARRRPWLLSRRLPATTFGVAVGAVEGLANLAWLFDWGGTATGSSTAGVLFVVLPILALGIGGIVSIAVGLLP
mgnify:CR=1 FL=1